MSGGSYNYIYSKLLDECSGCMCDDEMNGLIDDLAKVLHDLEWWQSADMSEDEYRATLAEFKDKWLKGEQEKKQKEQADERESYDGTYVWGTLTDLNGSVMEDCRLTLPEIAQMMSSVGGKNHKVFWRKERSKRWKGIKHLTKI